MATAPALYNIGDIQEALGIKVTAEFIVSVLDIEPHSVDKRAKLFTATQFEEEIKPRMIGHIEGVVLHAKMAPAPAKKAAVPAKKAAQSSIDDDDDDL